MGRFFSASTFLSAGNITHTPAYGHLIALGLLCSLEERDYSPEQIANAARYREMIAKTGRFLTFCGGGPTIGYRMRENPADRLALKIVRETDAGLVISGKIGMHTSPAYAEDLYVGSVSGLEIDGQRVTFIVPINAPGITVLCRKIAARDKNPFVSPLSSRFDELDGQMWLDDVFVPWESVFFLGQSPEPVVRWLIWHHLYGWLSKAEFTLGLALALSHAMGLSKHDQTIDYLVDLTIEVQTVRSCLTACERDPRFTASGYCVPNHAHLSAGGLAILRARPRMAEILRIVPGSSLVVAPSDRDLAAPELAERFGGIVWRRRLHRIAADGVIADGLGPCVLGARWARVGVRTARERRGPGMARPASPQFRKLQRSREPRRRLARHGDARDRPRSHPRGTVGAAPHGRPAPARRKG